MPNTTFSMGWEELSEVMKRLKPITSTQETRLVEQSLHFHVDTAGEILVTALDGYSQASVLTRCGDKPEQTIDFLVLPFDVPKVPRLPDPTPVQINVTDKEAIFTFNSCDHVETRTTRLVEAVPFDIANAIPKAEPLLQFVVNPYYLIDAIKATMAKKKDHSPIVLNFYGELNPLIVTGNLSLPCEAMVFPMHNNGHKETSTTVIEHVRDLAKRKE